VTDFSDDNIDAEGTYLGRLVNEKNIRASVPSPHACFGAIRSICHLNNLAWTILSKHANQTAASRTSIDPDGQRGCLRVLSCLGEPEKGVDRVVLLDRLQCEGRQAWSSERKNMDLAPCDIPI
jgi:hypothetical protein